MGIKKWREERPQFLILTKNKMKPKKKKRYNSGRGGNILPWENQRN